MLSRRDEGPLRTAPPKCRSPGTGSSGLPAKPNKELRWSEQHPANTAPEQGSDSAVQMPNAPLLVRCVWVMDPRHRDLACHFLWLRC